MFEETGNIDPFHYDRENMRSEAIPTKEQKRSRDRDMFIPIDGSSRVFLCEYRARADQRNILSGDSFSNVHDIIF